jgi:hypothetical protein
MNKLDFHLENDPREKALRDAVYRAVARLADEGGRESEVEGRSAGLRPSHVRDAGQEADLKPCTLCTLGLLLLGQPGMAQTVSPPMESAGAIERVATLRTARAAHTATTLASAEVLVAGGMGPGGGSLASAELFDPTDATTRALGAMAEARAGHTATRLGDGRVLIAGGYNGEYLGSIEVFDPATGQFNRSGALLEGRSGHTATLLPDGRLLFVGGVGRAWTFLRSAELYDPATGRSEAAGSMMVPRESHTATLLADGRVLVVGGHSGRRQAMEVYSSAEVFDPQTERFAAMASLGTARHKHDAVRLADGRVLVIGGADRSDRVYYPTTEIYAPETGTFVAGPTMAHARYKIAGTSVLLPNGDVLISSGARIAEVLDVRELRFGEVAGGLPQAYRFATATSLPSGDVLIAGGYADNNENTAGIWLFSARR